MMIFYYSRTPMHGVCYDQPKSQPLQWNMYGTDCLWMVPGMYEQEVPDRPRPKKKGRPAPT